MSGLGVPETVWWGKGKVGSFCLAWYGCSGFWWAVNRLLSWQYSSCSCCFSTGAALCWCCCWSVFILGVSAGCGIVMAMNSGGFYWISVSYLTLACYGGCFGFFPWFGFGLFGWMLRAYMRHFCFFPWFLFYPRNCHNVLVLKSIAYN